MEKSTILSVSSKNPSFNCKNVAEKLKDCGIQCKLTQNNSIIKKGHMLFAEIGCSIELFNFDNKNLKTHVWEPLKYKYNFDCAHLSIEGEYGGCIHDYFKDDKSSCKNK
jgi:hypothetical protein